jgi:MoaA/NifB/PqqE/SkfB family radical SAM enzyme
MLFSIDSLYGYITKSIALRRIPSAKSAVKTFIYYNLFQHLSPRPFLPRAMCLYVTYRCNMRCKMCGIWKLPCQKSNDFSLQRLRSILTDPLFSKLEYININGGEPSLREDLSEIIRLLIEKLPKLKTITINSNGLDTEKVLLHTTNIAKICKKNKIRFSISISLHQLGTSYDNIACVVNAYSHVFKTLQSLKDIHLNETFYLATNCVISNLNVYNSYKMLEWSKKEDIPINFTLGEIRDRFNNEEMQDDIAIEDNEKKKFLIDFFKFLAQDTLRFKQHALRYKSIADMLQYNTDRPLSCHYAMGGFILGAEGSIYYCKKSEAIGNCNDKSPLEIFYDPKNLLYRNEQLLNRQCRSCIPNSFIKQETEKDLLKCLGFFLKKRLPLTRFNERKVY